MFDLRSTTRKIAFAVHCSPSGPVAHACTCRGAYDVSHLGCYMFVKLIGLISLISEVLCLLLDPETCLENSSSASQPGAKVPPPEAQNAWASQQKLGRP